MTLFVTLKDISLLNLYLYEVNSVFQINISGVNKEQFLILLKMNRKPLQPIRSLVTYFGLPIKAMVK